jgi:hypothetical protein
MPDGVHLRNELLPNISIGNDFLVILWLSTQRSTFCVKNGICLLYFFTCVEKEITILMKAVENFVCLDHNSASLSTGQGLCIFLHKIV